MDIHEPSMERGMREGVRPKPGYPVWTVEDLRYSADLISRIFGWGAARLEFGIDGTATVYFRLRRQDIEYLCAAADAIWRWLQVGDWYHEKLPRREKRKDMGGAVTFELGDYRINGESLGEAMQDRCYVHVVIEEIDGATP